MENNKIYLRWPKDPISVECYGNRVMNYRYHWHPEEYELNILLDGHLEFCRGNETAIMRTGDVVLTPPGVGHASFSLQDPSFTLVLRFSASALRPYCKKGCSFLFPDCQSNEETRNQPRYKRLRYYAAQIYLLANNPSPYAMPACKAAVESLLATLCMEFNPVETNGLPEAGQQQELIAMLTQYMEAHYWEKLTLEDLAQVSGYNRTYVSTLFKTILNVNFHELLSRIRFRHALMDLASTNKPLTEIALNNGFSDLKSFNAKFREYLHRSPSEYRAQLQPEQTLGDETIMSLPFTHPILSKKLKEYTDLL